MKAGKYNADNFEGSDNPLPGWYHVVVQDCEETILVSGQEKTKGEEYPVVKVDVEILAGKPAEQEGKKDDEALFLEGKDEGKAVGMFAVAVGLVTVKQLKAAQQSGEDIDIDWSEAIGRQLCMELIPDKKQADKGYPGCVRCNCRYYAVDDPAVKDIPKNLSELPPTASPPPTAPAGDTAPPPATPETLPAPANDGDDLADLCGD